MTAMLCWVLVLTFVFNVGFVPGATNTRKNSTRTVFSRIIVKYLQKYIFSIYYKFLELASYLQNTLTISSWLALIATYDTQILVQRAMSYAAHRLLTTHWYWTDTGSCVPSCHVDYHEIRGESCISWKFCLCECWTEVQIMRSE